MHSLILSALPLPPLNAVESIRYSWKGIHTLLSPSLKRRTYTIYIFSSLIGLADIIGLGSMVPVLMLAIDHSFLEKSSKLRAIYHALDLSNEATFLKILIVAILLFFVLKSLLAIALQKHIRLTAIDLSTELAAESFSKSFQNNSYEKVSADGLGFNDEVMFTPYYFVSGIYFPFINIIAESTIAFMLILVFTLYNPMIFLLIVGLLGTAFVLVNRFTRKRISNLGEKVSESREKAIKDLNFGISGFADIRTHGVEKYFKKRFLAHFHEYVLNGVKGLNYQLIPSRINEFVSLLGIVILVIYAYFFSGDNLGQVRVLAALFAISVFRLIPAANRVLQALMHLKMNAYTIEKLMPLKTEKQKLKTAIRTFEHSIVLDKINFAYQNKSDALIFENLNLKIKRGDIVGISGKSGMGKTTLVKLLLGFYFPQSGSILVDGLAIKDEFDIQSLFSFMGQDPFIVAGSVADNVALGVEPENRDNQKIAQCLTDASFQIEGANSIEELFVGESGSRLSEGQKQRLVLARELYRDAPVLILDEPTSSLDNETEDGIIKTLRDLKLRKKTMIIIAHRERIFEICDFVLNLEGKKLTIRK